MKCRVCDKPLSKYVTKRAKYCSRTCRNKYTNRKSYQERIVDPDQPIDFFGFITRKGLA